MFLVLMFAGITTAAQPNTSPPPALTLTLEQAVGEAYARHPQLAKLRAAVALRHAMVRSAAIYPFNPELSLSSNARIGDETSVDMEAGLEQEFEIAGQRGKRKAVANAELDAVTVATQRTLRMISAEIRLEFVHAAAQRELLEVARAELEISRQLVELANRRLAAGAGTRLEIAVAGAELSKSEEQANSAAGEYAIARAELAYSIGLEPGALPEPKGDVREDEPSLEFSMVELMQAAQQNREDLLALRKAELAAEKRVELARAEAWPSLKLGVFAGQEASSELLVGGGVSIPLPLFQRNQGGIAVAEAEQIDAEADTALAEQDVLRDVAIAYQQYVAARQSLESLRANVVSTNEALQLLRRAFETGKSSWVEILVMRRTLFDAQRALVKITAGTHRARIKLDAATGTTPVPAGILNEVGSK